MRFPKPDKSRLRWIRLVLFILALIPLARLVWLAATESLGANPIEFIERSTGTWALVMLLIALSLTPLRLLTGVAWPIQLRRMAGLFMFFYACLHFTSYIWLDHWFDWREISKHIIKHPYVLVGFLAFILSIPLALTSSNAMMRKLGRRWKHLHAMVYPIAILAVLHFWWLVKKDIREPLAYAVVLLLLLGIRLIHWQKNLQRAKHPGNAGS